MLRLISQPFGIFRACVTLFGVATSLCLATQPAFSQTPELPEELETRYLAAARIKAEYQPVFRGTGVVFVGRLVAPEKTPVASRAQIMKDGSFATAVFPGRKLIFYAHGHEALVVEDGKEIAPSLFDVGDQRFTPTPRERQRSVTGSVRFAKLAADGQDEITVALGIKNQAYLYSDEGHRGGNVSVSVDRVAIRPGERFNFGGLSRIPYELTLSAPGYVTVTKKIDPKAVGMITVDTIALSPAPKLVFTYVAQLDAAQAADATGLEPKQQTVICDGENRFVYTEDRDNLRNRLYLRLEPDSRGVEASFWASPSEFYDLGPGTLGDIIRSRDWMKRLPKASGRQLIQPGRVYFFRNRSRNTSCLFAVGS